MAALLGAIPSLLGGVAGLFNKRPPSLSPVQSGALNNLIPSLQQGATAAPHIDPTQQALMYNNVAANQTGGFNAANHALTAAGLGHSGLLGNALTQVANQAQQSRNQGDMGLQQEAFQRQQFDIQALLQAIGVNNTPGQSNMGAFSAGIAPVAAYSIQNMLNNRGAGAPGAGANNAAATPFGAPPVGYGGSGLPGQGYNSDAMFASYNNQQPSLPQ